MRIKGLAASFHVEKLLQLAEEALVAVPGEPSVVRKLSEFVAEFEAG
jgi:hypothetical protein